jgi:hypothetical protein
MSTNFPNFRITRHAVERASQRAIQMSIVETVLLYGSDVPGGVFMRERDANSAITQCLGELSRLQRDLSHAEAEAEIAKLQQIVSLLRSAVGVFVPTANGYAKSVYRPSPRRTKKLLIRHPHKRWRAR